MQLSRLLSAVIQKLNKPVCCCYWRYLVLYENIPVLYWHSFLSAAFRTFSSLPMNKDHLAIIRRGSKRFVSRKSLCEVSASAKSNPTPALISFGRFSPPEKTLGAFMTKIPEISVGFQMERSVSVSSDRNIRDHLYFGRNIPTEIRHSIFDKPVLCPS